MTEQLLQFIWQFQHFNVAELKTTAGEPLEIIYPGSHNKNQGPDFLNGKIKCSGTLLAGNIEIHLRASEWAEHGHSNDKNYGNVILHVVLKEDRQLGLHFPTLELGNRISKILLAKYKQLMQAQQFVACQEHLHKVNELVFISWKERLLTERLQEKSSAIQLILQKNKHHWEETFWQVLAGNFGMKINREAFERIAASLPLTILAKHKPQPIQLEALLLGQAGLLEGTFADDYAILLQKEFQFLQKKYSLPATHIPVYFLRMRPANFPTIRLAQLAMLIHESEHLFSRVKGAAALKEVQHMFNVTANDYWHYHYSFDESTTFKKKSLGAQMTDNIILNTVLPMLYAYGWYNNAEQYKTKAMTWANELKAEKNNITGGFEKLGIANNSAGDSQALLQLKNKYCNVKRCLDCSVGNAVLKGLF